MAISKSNETLIDRMWEDAWNEGDLSVVDEALASDYVLHAPSAPEGVRGREEVKQLLRAYHEAFPDLAITVDDRIVGETAVVDRYTFRGTHKGEFMGISPTGIETEHTGIVIHYLEDDKVVKDVVEFDAFDVMQQLGVVERPD